MQAEKNSYFFGCRIAESMFLIYTLRGRVCEILCVGENQGRAFNIERPMSMFVHTNCKDINRVKSITPILQREQ